MAPTPKPTAQRRRKNAIAGVAVLSSGGRQGKLPVPKTEIELCSVAMDYWKAIWASPMAIVYTDVDIFPLTRLVVLVHEREMGLAVAASTSDSEIRQLEDRFGVSPLARRRLNWEIEQAERPERPAAPVGASVMDRLQSVA